MFYGDPETEQTRTRLQIDAHLNLGRHAVCPWLLGVGPLRSPQAAKKDQSEDERAKQIRTGERARSEDHEDD